MGGQIGAMFTKYAKFDAHLQAYIVRSSQFEIYHDELEIKSFQMQVLTFTQCDVFNVQSAKQNKLFSSIANGKYLGNRSSLKLIYNFSFQTILE